MEQTEQKLFRLLEKGTSAVLVVQEAEARLKEAGFEELKFNQTWGLTEKGKYYVKHHDTTLFAFTTGEQAVTRGTPAVLAGAASIRAVEYRG